MLKELIEQLSRDFLSDTSLPMVKFPITPRDVKFISNPNDFFQTLIEGISSSKKRIYFSSLYLGSLGEKEGFFLRKMKEKVIYSPSCKVHLHLDRSRSMRAGPSSIIPHLKSIKGPNFTSSLYQTDSMLAHLSPPFFKEIWSLSHLKIALFDDSVLISGANLSEEYFTIKQDRYCLIASEELCNFFQELFDIISHISYIYHLGEERSPSADRTIFPLMIGKLFHKYSKQTGKSLNSKTYLIPILQMAPLMMPHDPLFIANILKNYNQNQCITTLPLDITISSAYYNPHAIKKYFSHNEIDPLIITASIKSNSFYESKGLKGIIPLLYNSMAMSSIPMKDGGGGGIHFYTKKGHYFHGKGLWFKGGNGNGNMISIMAMGSSNYGNRSLNRDLECQLYFITENKVMIKKIDDDLFSLLDDCTFITNNCIDIDNDNDNDKISIFHRICSRLLSSFL